MKTLKLSKKSGFTLTELLVVIAIFSLVLGEIYLLFGFGNKIFSKGTKQYDIQSSSRLALDYVTQQLRYAGKIEIKDNGFSVPEQASLEPYQNYIYVEGKSIVHINKYFKKTYPVGLDGKIDFVSDSPFKNLSFTINAYSGKQEYMIKGDIYPLNLHLGTGIVEGTVSKDPNKKVGNIIYFKTASDYLSERLKPIAITGSFNEETKLTINYDRDIINAEIVNTSNVTEPDVDYSGRIVTLTATDAQTNGKVIIRVTFGDMETYGNTYDYTAIYDGESDTWVVE